ncbi:hypothetical protein K7H22_13610 [Seohaeicola saemankumensis]|uniref:hypothetical protein n=1 Tax=Seohaeicola saemankumensis TaxID=481181 RepID=UPI001E2B5E8D|nr:hypothetical protein [Seohaeicola saemankumensis]MCD1627033.1 hypothetical protein [Seohaeicola saemankumensis]
MSQNEEYTGYYIGCTADGTIRKFSEYRTREGTKLSFMNLNDDYSSYTLENGRTSTGEIATVFETYDVEFVSRSLEGGALEKQIIEKIKAKSNDRKMKHDKKT